MYIWKLIKFKFKIPEFQPKPIVKVKPQSNDKMLPANHSIMGQRYLLKSKFPKLISMTCGEESTIYWDCNKPFAKPGFRGKNKDEEIKHHDY